jgi:hypothetical protein
MRPKILVAVLSMTVILLTLLSILKPGGETSQGPARGAVPPSTGQTDQARPADATPPVSEQPRVLSTNLPAGDSDQQSDAEVVSRRIEELRDLSANDDTSSLMNILSDLENTNTVIRDAALQAAIQFASRDAIPTLQQVAARTEDAAYRKALADAADYLRLPSVSELLDEDARKRASAR